MRPFVLLMLLSFALTSAQGPSEPSNLPDHYATLGVTSDASDDEIKKRYRQLAKENHPDKARGSSAAFERIAEAYQVLGNSVQREQYNTLIKYGVSISMGDSSGELPSTRYAQSTTVKPATQDGWMDGLNAMATSAQKPLLVQFYEDEVQS